MGASREPITEVFIPVRPISKERARVKIGRPAYTPKRTKQFEDEIAEWYRSSGLLHKYEHPVKVTVVLCKRGFWLRIEPADCDVVSLPGDVDNKAKAIGDGLNKVAWNDDKLIVDLHVRKMTQAEDAKERGKE